MAKNDRDREREVVLACVCKRFRENPEQWKVRKGEKRSCYIYSAPNVPLVIVTTRSFSYRVAVDKSYYDYGLFSGAADIWLSLHPVFAEALENYCRVYAQHNGRYDNMFYQF